MTVTYVYEGRVLCLENLRLADQAQWRVGLYVNTSPITPATAFADMVVPNYTGYAPQIPTFAPAALVGGLGRIDAQPLTFAPTAPGPSATVQGFYLFHNGFQKLLFVSSFDAPKVMAVPADSVQITPAMTENQG
jgi:hypothetical protein